MMYIHEKHILSLENLMKDTDACQMFPVPDAKASLLLGTFIFKEIHIV